MSKTESLYRYLNHGAPTLFFSRLAKEIASAQKRAPISQWIPFIRGLTTKGVRSAEIDDSKLLLNLGTRPADTVLTREEILQWLIANTATVKEMDLVKPQYASFAQARNPGDSYQETLYVLQGEKENIADRLQEIRFEMEDLDFNPERIAENPLLVVNLYNEQKALMERQGLAQGITFGHWSDVVDPDTGKRVANMVGHVRASKRGGLYFIEEIQSDWAQRGRKAGQALFYERARTAIGDPQFDATALDLVLNAIRKNDQPAIDALCRTTPNLTAEKIQALRDLANAPADWGDMPRGPWVTNTELWSGLLLRRHLQRAASQDDVTRVAWINGNMRNGWNQESRDGLSDFYLKILPKLADKLISGTGEKVKLIEVSLGGNQFSVPGIEVTDKVREKLKAEQPLYSRDIVLSSTRVLSDHDYAAFNRALQQAKEMLGDGLSVRLAARVIDAATGAEVAGQLLGRMIDVSVKARNPARTLSHEAWHYAYFHLLAAHERETVSRAFADGTSLNQRVRIALVRDGSDPQAIAQCDDPSEAAAHGFALWMDGLLPMTSTEAHKAREAEPLGQDSIDRSVGRIFRSIERAFSKMGQWLRRIAPQWGETGPQRDQRSTAEMFVNLRDGVLRDAAELDRFSAWAGPMFPRNEDSTDIEDEGMLESMGSPFSPRQRAHG